MLYFYLKKRPPTEESIQLPLFCHTKRTAEPKMPYFATPNAPIKLITLVLPHQTHLGTKNKGETLQFSSVQSSSVQLFNINIV